LFLQDRYSVLLAAIAGLAIGFGGAALAYRYGLLPVAGERPFQRMARVLQLTPAQRDQVHTVMHQTHDQIEAARRAYEQQRHAIFMRAYLRIHELLTPGQQTVFDARFVPPSLRAEARAQLQAKATPAPSPVNGAH
jgi:Spy/CpxP family protein refolding chaperone